MKEVLRQLIIDFHREPLPESVARDISIPQLPRTIRKAVVLLGMRRSGKTWALYRYMQNLIESGLPKEKLLYLNFEDDRLMGFSHTDFQFILDAYFELYPEYANSGDVHFLLDEIHEIDGWEKFIRRLLDKEKIHLYLCGSSSKMLGKEIAASLRGRTVTVEVFPFSFHEFLRYHNSIPGARISTKERSRLVNLCYDFLEYGGFPERLFMGKPFFHNLLQGYLDVVIYRDVVERYKVGDPHVVRELLTYCIQNCCSMISVLNMYNRLKTLGRVVGKNTLYEYMDHLEDAYCLFSVPLHTHSHARQALNPKKLFAVDQGLITACSVKTSFEQGMRFENTVFSALRRRTDRIRYYRTRSGKEVDFAIAEPRKALQLIQATQTVRDGQTRSRELSALWEAMEELGLREGTILTIDETENVVEGKRSVRILPLWQWLLAER